MFFRLPGSHVRSWETWQSWPLQELPALQWAHWHPWGSQTLGSPLEMLSLIWETSSFDYLTTFIKKACCAISQLAVSWLLSQGLWLFAGGTLLQCAWDSKAQWGHSHNLTLSCRRACATPGCTSGTAMVSLLQLGLVFSQMVPYLMKPTTWQVYLLNNMYHHTTASFSTASPSVSYVPRARYNQEGKKKGRKSAVLRFQNSEGKKIYCSFPWKDRSYQKTLTTTTVLFMSKNLVLLVLFIYTAVTARCQTQRKVPDAQHVSKQS